MKLFKIIVLILVHLLVVDSQYNTNPNRAQSVTTFCQQQGLNRDNLLDEQAQARNDEYMAAMEASFSADGNDLFVGILDGGNVDFNAVGTQVGLFVGAFVIGLVIIILIWMFLCCCCLCPSCCPSKCCQKNQNQQYTKCQLIWPTVVLILALLLASVASIIGLTNSSDIESSLKSTSCAVAITFDDIINGNVSSSGDFFAGLSTIQTQLNKLNDNLGFVEAQLDKIDNDGTEITDITVTSFPAFQTVLDNLPSGSGSPDTQHPSITYNFDAPVGASSGDTFSIMPQFLGHKSDSSSACGAVFQVAEKTKDAVVSTSSAAQDFKDGIGDFRSGFGDVESTLADMTESLTSLDQSLTTILTTVNEANGSITIAVTAIFGVIIFFSILGITGALIMTFCNKFKCRYLVYFTCLFLFIMGIVFFLLSVIFAILTPGLYYACTFLTTSTGSQQGFKDNFGSLLGDTAGYISVCLPGASGDMLNAVGGDIVASMEGLTDAMKGMSSFQDQQFSSAITTAWNQVKDTLEDYYSGKTLDFEFSDGKDLLEKIADPNNYHNGGSCNDPDILNDFWVPSVQSGADVGCPSGSTAVSTCVSGDIDDTSSGCVGCLDSFNILIVSSNNNGVNTDLGNRYTGCALFKTQLQHVWTNFYAIKYASAGYGDPTSSNTADLMFRLQDADTNQYATYVSDVDDVDQTFADVFGNLTSTLDSVVNPQYGLIAGFNCLVFGEDLSLTIQTLCVKFFNTVYLARLTLGITAFGILFAMCCSVCTGVRHYKHSLRIAKTQDVFDGANQQSNLQLDKKY